MKDLKEERKGKMPYEEPKVTATYRKKDVEGAISPHGPRISVDNYIIDIPPEIKLS